MKNILINIDLHSLKHKNNKQIMSNPEMRKLWESFKNDSKYNRYFLSNEEEWIERLEKIKMGKISAAKKMAKRKDFQKTKLKVGRKLPKNTNETRATFKAKTLIIKQQFQLEKEGPVSHRNLSWKVNVIYKFRIF